MDTLSEILRVVRLSGAIFINARFTAPWCYQSPSAETAGAILEPGAEKVVIFHLIAQGQCVAELPGEAPVQLMPGDVVLFPHGDPHCMASAPGVPAPPVGDLGKVLARRPRQMAYGGGGAATQVVCGYLACDARLARLLLGGLPQLVRVNLRGSPSGAWLEASVRYALAEARAPRPGGAGVLAKLSEVLFMEVLRQYMNEQRHGDVGWLAGMNDRVVGAALKAIHARSSHPWTLEQLAREAGTSRSVLAERFQQLVGSSPIHYLTQWRMVMAANLLRREELSLSQVAAEVGYQSDTAFIRAFRREYGAPPASWRRGWVAARDESVALTG